MSTPHTLDLSSLPAYEISNRSPLWWGQLLMALIEASMFIMLLVMYVYLRLTVDVWPPPGTQLPHLTWATLALIVLILSAGGSYVASEGAKEGSRTIMLIGIGINLLLATVFIGLRFVELNTLNFRWNTDIHGTIFWAIMYLHTLDAVADMLFTLVLMIILLSGKYGEKQRLGVHVDSVLWYFIVLIWLPAYALLYLGPYLFGGTS